MLNQLYPGVRLYYKDEMKVYLCTIAGNNVNQLTSNFSAILIWV